MSHPFPVSSQLIFRPGAPATRVVLSGADVILEVPMPWLAGPGMEIIATGTNPREEDGLFLMPGAAGVAGVAVAPDGTDLYEAARTLYAAVLTRLQGQQLYRVWNYIPRINAETDGLENYRAFNAGRHRAFLEAYGPDFARRLPAASALGTPGGSLAIGFLAGSGPARHVENPEQIPAFQYPAEYGPTPPSFARGTVTGSPAGAAWFLSGTASIKGHATCGAGFADQARLTFDNVRLMFQRMALPAGASGRWKIFLRHPSDLPAAQAAFAEAFPSAMDDAMLLEADICRRALLLEVEATFQQPVFGQALPASQSSSVISV